MAFPEHLSRSPKKFSHFEEKGFRPERQYPHTEARRVFEIHHDDAKGDTTALEHRPASITRHSLESEKNVSNFVTQQSKGTEVTPEARLAAKREELLADAAKELLNVRRVLNERLVEQGGFLNRLRKFVSGTDRVMRAHVQDIDRVLKLNTPSASDMDLRSLRSTVKQMQETYGITTAPATARVQNETRVATSSVTIPIAESGRMTDLTPEQRQAKLIERATLPLQQALKNLDRNTGIKQAASGMVQVNQLIEQLMVPSKNQRFRLPEATANVIQDIHREFSPMANEIVNKTPDPKIAPTLTDLAGKTLNKELDRFSRFTENLGSVLTTSVDNNPSVDVEARGQMRKLMEAMFNSRLNHLREAVQNNQPDRIINVVREINRSLQQYDARDIPETVIQTIDEQLSEARVIFQRPVLASQEPLYSDMKRAEQAFNIFKRGYELNKKATDLRNVEVAKVAEAWRQKNPTTNT